MNSETQSIIAAGIVILTLAVFAFRIFRKKANGKPGCGSSCGCGKTQK